MELSEEQFERYARHLILDEVGEEGQIKLLASRVLVVGAGGLGSPLLLYLAAAGVGTIGITDADRVDLTNLQRQIVHATERVGALKVESACATLAAVNPGVRVEAHPVRLASDNAEALIGGYDLVADGSDNFTTRYLLTDLCFRLEKPLVAAALSPFEGQLSTFRPYLGPGHPCYRCLFREPPPPDLVPRCAPAFTRSASARIRIARHAAPPHWLRHSRDCPGRTASSCILPSDRHFSAAGSGKNCGTANSSPF
jgi:molybdopterin-synthase adenylyltransferase